MGSAASKAQKGVRRYPPSPSTLVNHPLSRPTQISNSFPLSGERSQHPEDVQAQLGGMPSGLDPKLAARLNQLGPVIVPKHENKTSFKPDHMMTILKNRTDLSQSLEDEIQNPQGSRKHVSVAIIREIIKARQKGWDAARITKEYNVDPSVITKLEGTVAIPVINSDGVSVWPQK